MMWWRMGGVGGISEDDDGSQVGRVSGGEFRVVSMGRNCMT